MTATERLSGRNHPVVIAHRGASGYLPEHTLAAKALAHVQGADYLEQDLVATRDGRVIVCHDLYLERITDVASVFPRRSRADGHFYAIDFAWPEIERLRVVVRPADCTAHQAADAPWLLSDCRISTFEAELTAIQELNRRYGREAGIYPEIKHPQWHAEHGVDLTEIALGILADFGYRDDSCRAYLQCFDGTELQRLHGGKRTRLPLIQLVGRSTDPSQLTVPGLQEIAGYAAGIGANYRQLIVADGTGGAEPGPIVSAVREAGLLLHPYTFNRESLPPFVRSMEELLGVVLRQLRPDGLFCDFPDIAVRLRSELEAAAAADEPR